MTFKRDVYKRQEGNPVTGFYAGRTHDIIANTNCILGAAVNEHILESKMCIRDRLRRSSFVSNSFNVSRSRVRSVRRSVSCGLLEDLEEWR